VLASRNASILKVWGTGAQMRDFIHIDDCVTGVLATMDKIDDGGALNLSTGIFTSFIDFAQLAANILGFKPEVQGLSDKPSGVHARGGDTAKQKSLGFEYTLSFKTGIERALAFYSAAK
jgi:GDP-L-fucose synthase